MSQVAARTYTAGGTMKLTCDIMSVVDPPMPPIEEKT